MGDHHQGLRAEQRGVAAADDLECLDSTRFVRNGWCCEGNSGPKWVGLAGREEDDGKGTIVCKLDGANSEDRNGQLLPCELAGAKETCESQTEGCLEHSAVSFGQADQRQCVDELLEERESDWQLSSGGWVADSSFVAPQDPGEVGSIKRGGGEAKIDMPGIEDGKVALDQVVGFIGAVVLTSPFDECNRGGWKGVGKA